MRQPGGNDLFEACLYATCSLYTVIWHNTNAKSIRDRSQFVAMPIQRTFSSADRLDTRIKH